MAKYFKNEWSNSLKEGQLVVCICTDDVRGIVLGKKYRIKRINQGINDDVFVYVEGKETTGFYIGRFMPLKTQILKEILEKTE